MMVVLEFCGNGSLKMLLGAHATRCYADGLQMFGVARATSYLADVAAGMEHLGMLRCFHRNLAAKSVLITHSGVAKIANLGLRRQLSTDTSVYQMGA